MRRFFLTKIDSLALCLVLLVSLALRLWGSDFGLPAYTRYHPDEHALVERAAQILWTGDWNLHRFNYPPFYAYLNTIADSLYFLYGVTQNLWEYLPTFVVPNYYQVGRWLTACFGTLTILVIYLVGRQLWNRRTGLLAALLLGGNYLHIIHSHYATFDIMVGFLAALTLLFSELIRTRQQARWYFLAGLCAGLAGATKYNGAVVLVLPLLAHLLATPWGEWGWLNSRLGATIGGFLLGFFGGNPFALGNLPDFLTGLATVLHHYGTAQPGFEGLGNWRWYPAVFLTSADALWVIAGTLGLLGLAWKEWRKALLLLSFPLIYYLLVSRFVVRFERNMVPLLPFLALGGGWLVGRMQEAGRRMQEAGSRRKEARGKLLTFFFWPLTPCFLLLALCLLLLALPLTAGISFDRILSRTDHREIAGRWVEENVAPGSKIAIEHYAIPFDYDRYQVEDVLRISNHDLDWYRQQGFDLLIVSDGVWPLLRRQPEAYGEMLSRYDDLIRGCRLLAEFVPEPPALVVAGYPTVAVYHFAPVRIYALSR